MGLKVSEPEVSEERKELIKVLSELALSKAITREWSISFSESVLAQFEKHGDLSDKQWIYVEKVIQEVLGVERAAKVAADLGDFSGVYELFAKVQNKGKHPRLSFALISSEPVEEGVQPFKAPVVIKPAGPHSANPGMLYVSNGGWFEKGIYYGKLNKEGTFIPALNTKHFKFMDSVIALLKALAKDPAGVAAAYGKLSNKCCFCNKALTDPKSVHAGFGPVCAKTWDLTDEWNHAANATEEVSS